MQNWNQTWSAWAVSIVNRRDRAYTINLIFLTVLLAVINSFPHRVYIATIYMSIYKTRTVWHHAIRPTQKLWCHIFGWLSNEIKSEPKRIAPTVADRQLVFELVLRVVREQERWGNRKRGVGTRSDPMFACCIRLKDIQYKGKANEPNRKTNTRANVGKTWENENEIISLCSAEKQEGAATTGGYPKREEVVATEVTYFSSLYPHIIYYFTQGIQINKHIE